MELEYESRICKTGDEGYDDIKFSMRFDSDACTTTLFDIKLYSYWPEFGDGEFPWHGFDKSVLNPKLQEMGLNKDQSADVVKELFKKLRGSFEGSGISEDPCTRYFEHIVWELSDEDINWGEA